MPIESGSRLFAPRAFTTLVTLALLVLLVSLGRWQLRRAGEQQRLYDAFATGGDAALEIDRTTGALPRYRRAAADGHYDRTRQILIDNMVSSGGQAGYYVLTPFELTGGGWLLVNRGWVPLGADRGARPDLDVGAERRTVHGRVDKLPSPGIRMGHPAPLAPPFPVVANFPSRADIQQLLHESAWVSAADVLDLDAREPDGYRRDWVPPGFAPMRHIAYAVQWFGLALALAVIYVVTNRRPAAAGKSP